VTAKDRIAAVVGLLAVALAMIVLGVLCFDRAALDLAERDYPREVIGRCLGVVCFASAAVLAFTAGTIFERAE
jgi:hypothetical protein